MSLEESFLCPLLVFLHHFPFVTGMHIYQVDGVKQESILYLMVQVSPAGIDVPHGSKPGQTLLVDKNPQWVTRCDQHIDTHVKLKAINKERL